MLGIDENIKIVGITGTNGKTTTAAAIYSTLLDLGYKCALTGTRGAFINDKRIDEKGLTTSSVIKTLSYLYEATKQKCEFLVMEVSSHAIAQNRIEGLKFALKIFTNLTQDHLDYHKTFEEYARVKSSFFADESVKLINKDDKFIKWIDKSTSQGITILYNQASSYKINTSCAVFNLNDLKIDKSFIIKEKILFKIKITANTEISEMHCNYDLKNNDDLKKLENDLIYSLTNILNESVYEVKRTKIDSIGLGHYIYLNDYKNYLKIKDNYLDNLNVEFEIFPNLLIYENSNEGTIKNNE